MTRAAVSALPRLFWLLAAASATLAASPALAQAPAPASREQAQQMIFTALDDATFKVFESDPPATGWYEGHSSDPCYTRYRVVIPPHTAGGAAKPARTYTFAVDWKEVLRAEPSRGYQDKVTVTRRSATEFFTLSGQRQAGFLAAANYLIRSCGTGAPATPSTPAGQIAAKDSPAFMLTGQGVLQPVPLGREFQVTKAMVVQHDSDFFSRYYNVMALRGRSGDRFTIAWRTSDSSPDIRFDDEALDPDYPKGQTIFDRTGSMTVTLKRDGEHRLSLSQLGKSWPKTSSGGLVPTISDGTPRDFLPYYLTIRKLDR